jgi:hypothetical protein
MSFVPSQLRDSSGSTGNRWRVARFLPAFMFVMAFLLLPAGSSLFARSESAAAVPITEIVAVARDNEVSIRTYNFPANTNFTVTMGAMGTRGVNGYVVGSVNSGATGSFTASFKIPAALYGSYQISIRLQSGGYYPYYSYNWFYNNSTAGVPEVPPTQPPTTPGYTGIPTFMITAVKRNDSVKIQTNNFPAGQTFNVTMGVMGTRGIGGFPVGTLESGAGGKLSATFTIPPELYDHAQIAIRAQTGHLYPYYAFNWFWNNDANAGNVGTGGEGDSSSGSESDSPPPAPVVYYGIPVITITKVVRDGEVTFQTYNYPANVDFSVTMGAMYTRGIGGIHVGDFNSGAGGSFAVTMPIPAALAGSSQISIRAQSHHPMPYAFYSYNWFFNNSTS